MMKDLHTIQIEDKKYVIKSHKPEQFPLDEILNEQDRIARGWATVEIIDNDGEIIPVPEFLKVMRTWFMRNAPITDQHSNRIVGKGLHWREAPHPDTGRPGIILDYQIYDHYKIDHKVWEEIKSGKRSGLSMGGQNDPKRTSLHKEVDGSIGRKLEGIELFEFASVDKPANALSTNIAVNYLAKSNKDDVNKSVSQGQKDFLINVIDFVRQEIKKEEVKKPFANYKNFEACVAGNQDKDDPNSYCATIMRAVEDTNKGEAEEYKPRSTSIDNDHAHVWKKGSEYTSFDDGHNHKINLEEGLALPSEDGHTHQLFPEQEQKKKSDLETEHLNNTINKKESEHSEEEPTMSDANTNKADEDAKDKPDAKETESGLEADNERMELLDNRLGKVEKSIEGLAKSTENVVKSLSTINKSLEKIYEGEEDRKKAEHKDDEDDAEKKKTATPPGQTPGEKETLPKAPAGETDETATPEADKVVFQTKADLQKVVDAAIKKVLSPGSQELAGLKKSVTTPRPSEDVSKGAEEDLSDPGAALLKRSKKGIVSANAFREVTKGSQDQREEQQRRAIDNALGRS